jgi:hypothetical protein
MRALDPAARTRADIHRPAPPCATESPEHCHPGAASVRFRTAVEEAGAADGRQRAGLPAGEGRRALHGIDEALSLLEDALSAGTDSKALRRRAVLRGERGSGLAAPPAARQARSAAALHEILLAWQEQLLPERPSQRRSTRIL